MGELYQQDSAAAPPALPEHVEGKSRSRNKVDFRDWSVLLFLAATCLYLARVRLVRVFYHLQINGNEGFNAYNAIRALHHDLYSARFGWTAVNYPFLSFYLIGHLSLVFGDPVLIGRVLSLTSLAILCVLIGFIVNHLTGSAASALFAATFCFAVFNTVAPNYVGMDDPQMLAQVFFLLGFFVYLKHPESNSALVLVVVLFAIGVNIKHNPIAAPIAVLVDATLISRARAARYLLLGLLALVVSYAANVWIGGPYFLSQLLTPRVYSVDKLLRCANLLLPAAIPILLAAIWSALSLKNRNDRIMGLYFFGSLVAGLFFFGGRGTAMNVFFDLFLAISIILGILHHSLWNSSYAPFKTASPWRLALPFVFVGGLYSYLPLHGSFRAGLQSKQQAFQEDVTYLIAQPGPAICEDILACYYAQKPFAYAPFNSTSLVRFGKLNPKEMIDQISARKFGAIEAAGTLSELTVEPHTDRFPPEILQAIGANYRIGRQSPWSVIYVPR